MDGNCYRQMAARLQLGEIRSGTSRAHVRRIFSANGRGGELIPVARFRLLLALLGELGLRLDSGY